MAGRLGINPWLTIWCSPRQTITRILKVDPSYRFVWLSAIYGFPMLLQISQSLSLSFYFSWPIIMTGALILSPFAGMLGFTIIAGLLFWVGRWIGGTGNFISIRAAVSWANAPNIVTGLSWLVLIALFQDRIFYDGFMQRSFAGREQAVLSFVAALQFVIAVWSFVLLLKTLAEVQRFSVWKALLNVILPFALFVIALWVAMWLIWWIKDFMLNYT